VQDLLDRLAASVQGSRILRLLLVVFLAILLQVPITMIGGLRSERQERQRSAAAEVSSKWGGAQTILGPALVVPYGVHVLERSAGGEDRVGTETRYAVFLPERLDVKGTVDADVRKRGIFSVPVYQLDAILEGEFGRPDVSRLGVEPVFVAWDRAHLVLGISDARAIQRETAVRWNGIEVPFAAGSGVLGDVGASGIHATVGVVEATGRFEFALPLSLHGSGSLSFTPFGQSTEVHLDSDYGHPSFQGNWLPSERTVSRDSFTARWSIPSLGRNFPQAWTSEASMRESIAASRFGVELVDPVDHYRMAERSVKYAGLFIVLTFATVWLVEVLSGVRVHPIQYLMLGGALCLFYLLELSLSEHVGFAAAYAAASVAVLAMVGAFCLVALRRGSRAVVVASGVGLLYAYLYVLLMNEDYALLIGSIGLFVVLATIMFATRRVDWYAASGRSARTAVPS
jgi:inner membrane protein